MSSTASQQETKGSGLRTVGISEFLVSQDPSERLITYSLGSCLGVTVHDPVVGVGGLIHCLLPLAKQSPEKGKATPAMFVDTGMVALLNAMFEAGAERRNLIVKAAGCASPMDHCGRFRIGERNFTILRKVLWKNELMIQADDTGGTVPRTLTLEMASGKTFVRAGRSEEEL